MVNKAHFPEKEHGRLSAAPGRRTILNGERKTSTDAAFWAVVLVILSLAFGSAVPAFGKDYYFPEVKIGITIDRDGSFSVEERRTFAFSGSFSWAELFIPLQVERAGRDYYVGVEGFSVEDEGGLFLRLEAGQRGGRFEAKWFFSARDELRTFIIRYRVWGGIMSYPDVSELYWQAVGDGWSKPTERAEVTVSLPQPLAAASDMLVYGHGPLSGMSEIVDSRTARFTAADIPAGQYLEIRVVWPSRLVAGVAATGLSREAIRAEEERFVQETIERGIQTRGAATGRKRAVRRWIVVWLAWLIAGPVLFLLFFIPRWKKTGKDYAFPNLSDYFREPPSGLPPALVEHLRKEGVTTTPRAFTATIFDLARRGLIQVEDRLVVKTGLLGSREKTETVLTLKSLEGKTAVGHGPAALKPFEADVLDLVFSQAGGGTGRPGDALTVDDLKAWLKRRPTVFQKWFREWSKSIKAEGRTLGFVEPESIRLRNVFFLSTLPVGLLTANIPLFVLALVLVPKLLRRSLPWAEENEKWEGLERFLRDFAEFKDLPPQAYILWESYLVFGILFGQAKKIVRMLPVLLQDPRAAIPAWYYGFGQAGLRGHEGLTSIVRSIESAATSIEHASASAAHYSSGGGGGFSGGGGGGAG